MSPMMSKKTLLRAAAGLCAGTAVGALGLSAAVAQWSDVEHLSYGLSLGHATLNAQTPSSEAQLLGADGTSRDSVSLDLLTDTEYTTLAKDYRVAVPVSVTGTTHGKIGLDGWSIALDDKLTDVGSGSTVALQGKGPLLGKITEASRIVEVPSPDECTVELLDEPRGTDAFTRLDSPVLGEDATRTTTACVLLQVPAAVGVEGAHVGTTTATGTAGGSTGVTVKGTNTLQVNFGDTAAVYKDELAAQIAAGPVRATVTMAKNGPDGSPFNPGNVLTP